jgi:hypothetical protein
MQIRDEALTEFMALYRAEFGKEIPRQDAVEMATRLVNLYLTIYRPLPGELSDAVTRPPEDRRDPDAASQDAG